MSESEKISPSTNVVAITEASEDLPHVTDVDKLGRQRPEVFSSAWMEVAFVISVLFSLGMATWPSNVLTLVAGSFLFPLGRVADMYGGYLVFNGGLIWFTIWTIVAGFSPNFIMLVVCRALQGLGAAAFMPAGISLLGKIYRPGPRKNFIFSLYGAMAPLGFFAGIIVGGMAQHLLSWRWYFFIGGIIAAVFCVGSILTAPKDYAETREMGVKMDWYGVCTTVPGLMLVIYAITDSANAPGGWISPRILTTLILGLIFLGAAVYVEGWVAEAPLIPADIFQVKYIKRMLFIELVLGKSPLLTSVYFAPWAGGGVVLAITSGVILHVIPGRILLVICGVTQVIAVLMFALMPDHPNYWAWIFTAMLAEATCNDILWTVSNVFLTTSLPKRRQGLAGALISVTLFLGGAFFLAIVDVAKAQFIASGMDLKHQYKYVFWIGVGIAGLALLVCFFINLDKADGDYTVDEKEQQNREGSATDVEPVSENVSQTNVAKVGAGQGVIVQVSEERGSQDVAKHNA
ncbi:Efflux pump terJ-like protein [Cladobotryum mycophilum]|uniref:Efflux pump terJ-like protein n=1 Tax=Cladobotryum mycophilum TaxID=491253 RepID=A0ABR0S8G8_9HYPO